MRRKENEILHAEDKAKTRELELFGQVVDKVLERSTDLLKAADIVAQVDAFSGWAQLARDWNYCRPVVDNSDAIEIFDGQNAAVKAAAANVVLIKLRLSISYHHFFVLLTPGMIFSPIIGVKTSISVFFISSRSISIDSCQGCNAKSKTAQ